MVFNCFILKDRLLDFPFKDGASILVKVRSIIAIR
jgi:hypothetical protein